MITVSSAADDKLLKAIVGSLWIRIHLFINDRRPSYWDTVHDYVELDGHGYMPVTLTPQDWRLARDKKERLYTEARAAAWEFGPGNPQRVYGYFVTDQSSGDLLWAERLVTREPIVLQNQGERLRVICRINSPLRPRKG